MTSRRSFFRSLGLLAGAASVSPLVFVPKFEPVRWKRIHYGFVWHSDSATPIRTDQLTQAMLDEIWVALTGNAEALHRVNAAAQRLLIPSPVPNNPLDTCV